MNPARIKEQTPAVHVEGDARRQVGLQAAAPSGPRVAPRAPAELAPVTALDRGRVRTATRVARICAVIGLAWGLLVLAGWAFGIVALKSVRPSMVATKPNAALAFALTGTALLLLEFRVAAVRWLQTAVAMVLAAAIGLLGVLTLIEYAFGVDLGIDQLVFHEAAGAVGTGSPGRMAITSAICLVLAAGALVLVALRRPASEQIAASAVLAFAFSAFLSYLYRAEGAQAPGTTKVSAMSVAAFVFLGVALLLAEPQRGLVGTLLGDEPGGLMARWLLVAAAVTLPLLGGLRLAGENLRLYSASSGVGIMVIASLAVLIAAVAITASRLNALGRQRTLALQRLRGSERSLRRTLDHLLHVQENERRGLAMDLHDDALPALSAVNLQLELTSEQSDDAVVRDRLERAEADLRAITSRLRHLTFDLLPEALAREGLGGAVRHRLELMHELTGIEYELRDRIGTTAFPQAAAILYRSALEALRNVARHAQATSVAVTIEKRDDRLFVAIADDGVGIGPAPSEPNHMGLSMMRDRVELAGGGMDVRSPPGRGTIVTVWVPAGLSRGVETDV
jgi:signal transduction histidine kinase